MERDQISKILDTRASRRQVLQALVVVPVVAGLVAACNYDANAVKAERSKKAQEYLEKLGRKSLEQLRSYGLTIPVPLFDLVQLSEYEKKAKFEGLDHLYYDIVPGRNGQNVLFAWIPKGYEQIVFSEMPISRVRLDRTEQIDKPTIKFNFGAHHGAMALRNPFNEIPTYYHAEQIVPLANSAVIKISPKA